MTLQESEPGFHPFFPLSQVVFSDLNARRDSVHPDHIKNLETSVKELGFSGCLVVDTHGNLNDTMHRAIVLMRAGVTHAPVYVHDAKPNAEISISSDTQRPFPKPSQIKAIGQTYSMGCSTRTVAAAAQQSTDTTRRKVRFELNAIPELKALVQEESTLKMPLSKAYELARLEEETQLFELTQYLKRKRELGKEPETTKEFAKRVSEIITRFDKGISLDSLREKKAKDPQLAVDEVVRKLFSERRETPYENNQSFNLAPIEQEEDRTAPRCRYEILCERVAKLYQVGAVKKNDLEEAQTFLKHKRLDYLFDKESLYNIIKKVAKEVLVHERVITPEQAIKKVTKEDIVLRAQNARFDFLMPYQDVFPADYNARGEDAQEVAEELVESIKKNGVINPVLAHKTDKGVQLVYGHRRLAAARKAGCRVPTIILDEELNERELILYQLMEDSQRAFTTLELSSFYTRAYDEKKANNKSRKQAILEIAQASGRPEQRVERLLAYNKLPAFAQRAYSARLSTIETLDSLVDIPSEERRTTVIRESLRRRKQEESDEQGDLFGAPKLTPGYVLAQAFELTL